MPRRPHLLFAGCRAAGWAAAVAHFGDYSFRTALRRRPTASVRRPRGSGVWLTAGPRSIRRGAEPRTSSSRFASSNCRRAGARVAEVLALGGASGRRREVLHCVYSSGRPRGRL
ncbi:hypothetical protein DSL92_04020 [Billgrantia gudaonensis]|uniref:Uncharacterized protein n=1 Tax=Billgrantia gudaonensis TaxID=376427 RepID=A0A3S0NX65_9GAMM|nr:hypothetical protein DSL92_04020 [Halomonas gudaonensis]